MLAVNASKWLSSSWTTSVTCGVLYFGVVQPWLRWRRRDTEETDPRSMVERMAQWEDPFLYRLSLEFALFRTYAVPSISSLLARTGEFEQRCGKRYDDTDLLLREITEQGLESQRGRCAMDRMNQIHGAYRIKNDDFLYTLSAFLLEPYRFYRRFGWREYTTAEREQITEFWRSVGKAMNLTDIPETFAEFEAFNIAYEKKQFRFAPSNRIIADATVDLMLCSSSFLRPCVFALMDPPLLTAMGYDPAPARRTVIRVGLHGNSAIFHRYIALPRLFTPIRRTDSASDDPLATHFPLFNVYSCSYPRGYSIPHLGPAGIGHR